MNKEKFYNENEEALKDYFAKDYAGLDDNMPDAFESWWADLDDDDIEGLQLK